MANEKRLIDITPLVDECDECMSIELNRKVSVSWADAEEEFKQRLLDAPVVDAVEVVHGRWLYDSGSGKYFCSACDEYALSFKKDTLYGGDLYEVCLTDYCPNCGAKMDGDGNE